MTLVCTKSLSNEALVEVVAARVSAVGERGSGERANLVKQNNHLLRPTLRSRFELSNFGCIIANVRCWKVIVGQTVAPLRAVIGMGHNDLIQGGASEDDIRRTLTECGYTTVVTGNDTQSQTPPMARRPGATAFSSETKQGAEAGKPVIVPDIIALLKKRNRRSDSLKGLRHFWRLCN